MKKYTDANGVECYVFKSKSKAKAYQSEFNRSNYIEGRKAIDNPSYKPQFKIAGYKKDRDGK